MAKEYTLKDVISAMRQNGYEQYFGAMYRFDYDTGNIMACALGQVVLNLSEDPLHVVKHSLFDARFKIVDEPIIYTITRLNDHERWPLNKIADFLAYTHMDVNPVVLRERG